MKSRPFYSLQARYLILVIILGSILLTGAMFGYRNLTQTTTDITANLAARTQLLEYSRNIRVDLFESHKSLHAFLLDPTRSGLRERVHARLQNARGATLQLLNYPWVKSQQQSSQVEELENALILLEADIQHLEETRLDPARQYPSLEAGNIYMQPNRNAMNNAIALAVNETAAEAAEGGNLAVYDDLIEARHLWTQLLSNFRMYLANRVGSFNEDALPVQANAIETMYKVLREKLGELEEYQKEERLGFETGVALDTIISSTDAWFDGFQKVRAIHNSGEWRADIMLIKAKIEPRLNHISNLLSDLEIVIAEATARDMSTLSDVAEAQTRISWVSGGSGILFILLILISLDRLVFRPIKGLTNALEAEAYGKDDVTLPETQYSETRNLLHAFSAMSKQVRERQNALQHQAMHDSLTGLPNRTLLQDRLEQAIHHADRDGSSFAFMIMDLDRFKEINDSLGHHIGDHLLHEVGKRLILTLREVDTVARIGGDEFAILISNSDEKSAPKAAEKLNHALAEPFEIDQLKLYVGGSIGIAMYPQHGPDARTLVQRADVAMYMAKRGKLQHSFYDPSQDEYTIDRLTLITDLRHALEQQELALYYQPKLDIALNSVVGAEALLRWKHPVHGYIPPEQAINLAEHTGLIIPLTYWVLDQAIDQCSQWHQADHPIKVSVNLSVHTFRDNALVDNIQGYLQRHALAAEHLVLEITESAMMANPTQAIETLNRLDAMGVQLSIDDFGTGFSSLAYLKKLPVDELKIDKAFVLNMDQDPDDEVIVRSTVDLAHNLRLNVTAEGVETQAAWEILAQLGCDTAQGYLISRPLPVERFNKWLHRQMDRR